ncbi:MAG: ribosome assembly factor SBDS [Candidatus Aenigmatarchaeota archaeon]
MISVDEAVIARLDSHGKHFEILVHPERGLEVKKGKDIDLDDLVAMNDVYGDVEKGKKASQEELNEVFGTNDFKEIAYKIIRKGEVQLTTQQRKEMRERKRKEIANTIARRAVNPQTDKPHPPKRIMNAMDEAGVHVDETMDAKDQVSDVIDALRPIIPISIETIRIAVRVPAEYAGKASGSLRDIGKLQKEEWRNDGSWMAVVKMPAGLQDKFYKKVNSLTKGNAETKVMKKDN